MANKLILIVSLPPSRSGSRLIETDPEGEFGHRSTGAGCQTYGHSAEKAVKQHPTPCEPSIEAQ